MSGFVCPFCKQTMSVHSSTYTSQYVGFKGILSLPNLKTESPYMLLEMFRCPNDLCKKETIIAKGYNGCLDNRQCYIYPSAIYRHFPDYVPKAIRIDYEEACLIKKDSPKASATLARRCLQGMIRDYWSISGKKNLYQEIDAIKDLVPSMQWKAIDAVRKIGNIGAHMERDVDLIIDVDPEEAEKLLQLIELLVDKWYIARHDEESLYQSIVSTSLSKEAEKHP